MKVKTGWIVPAMLVVVAAVGCRKAEEASNSDRHSPVSTRPARPEFHERMMPDTFDQRFKEALAKLPPITELEKKKGAAWGYRLTSVDAGSQGEKAGLHVGDTIIAIDGQRAWSELRLSRLRKNTPQKLTVVGEDLTSREVTVPPGRIGVHGSREWNPALVYLRGPHRDKRWDDLIRVAIAQMWDNPDLAETAMARAMAQGYPGDGISDLIAYSIRATRPESAAELLAIDRLRNASGEYGADMPVWPRGLYWAALAEGDLDTAFKAMEDGAPEALADTSVQLDRLIEARGATTRPAGPTPSEQVARMKRTPMIRDCRPANQYAQWYLDRINKNKGEPLRISAQTGHFMPLVLASPRPARDVVAEIRFRVKPTDDQNSEWAKMFAVGLMDLADPRPSDTLDQDGMPGGILGLAAWSGPGTATLFHGYGEELAVRPAGFALDGSEEVTIRFVHVAGWDEIFLNDDRIAYLPWTAPCNKLALYVKTVGMTAIVSNLTFDLLEENK